MPVSKFNLKHHSTSKIDIYVSSFFTPTDETEREHVLNRTPTLQNDISCTWILAGLKIIFKNYRHLKYFLITLQKHYNMLY